MKIRGLSFAPVAYFLVRNRFKSTIVILSLCIIATSLTIVGTRYNGDISKIFKDQAADDQSRSEKQQSQFQQPGDQVLYLTWSQLTDADALKLIRDLHLDIELVDGVGAVLSVFSVPRYDTAIGKWTPTLPDVLPTGSDGAKFIKSLDARHPNLKTLLSTSDNGAILLVLPTTGSKSRISARATLEISELLGEYAQRGLVGGYVGTQALERELIAKLITDQVQVSILGIAICLIIAWFLMGQLVVALACTTPIVIALLFYLGAIAGARIEIDPITAIIPILVIILTFAETLHLLFHWRLHNGSGHSMKSAVVMALHKVGPACALSSLTTAIAFTTFYFTGSASLKLMAISGMLGVACIFLSVMFAAPLAIIWLSRFPAVRKMNSPTFASWLARRAAMLTSRRWLVGVFGILLATSLFAANVNLPIRFQTLDYVPMRSEYRAAITKLENSFAGGAVLHAVIERKSPAPFVTKREVQEIQDVIEVVESVFGSTSVLSLDLPRGSGLPSKIPIETASLPQNIQSVASRFLTNDRTFLTLTVFTSHRYSLASVAKLVDNAEHRLRTAVPGTTVKFTGSLIGLRYAVPELISDLRYGLILSVVFSLFAIGTALRSWRLGLACLIPNILPILVVEAFLFWMRGGIDITSACALTVGFGLAVDDSIHLLINYRHQKRRLGLVKVSLIKALATTSPALVATTIILSLGICATLVSSLPVVILFGQILVLILVSALVFDLFLLPSLIALLDRDERRRGNHDHISS